MEVVSASMPHSPRRGNDPARITQISLDKEKNVLKIRDRGVGMTKADLVNNLGTIAKSGTSAFLEQMQKSGDMSLIGQFGVGFYSVYLVADYVEVISKNNDDKQCAPHCEPPVPSGALFCLLRARRIQPHQLDSPSSPCTCSRHAHRRSGEMVMLVFMGGGVAHRHIWESKADGNFAVSEDTENEDLGRGTQINIYLKDDAAEYADEDKLRELVGKYSEFINFPIYMYASKEVSEEVPVDEEDEEDVDEEDDEEDEEEDEGARQPSRSPHNTTLSLGVRVVNTPAMTRAEW
jgi:HSP90 family molecular chaperone